MRAKNLIADNNYENILGISRDASFKDVVEAYNKHKLIFLQYRNTADLKKIFLNISSTAEHIINKKLKMIPLRQKMRGWNLSKEGVLVIFSFLEKLFLDRKKLFPVIPGKSRGEIGMRVERLNLSQRPNRHLLDLEIDYTITNEDLNYGAVPLYFIRYITNTDKIFGKSLLNSSNRVCPDEGTFLITNRKLDYIIQGEYHSNSLKIRPTTPQNTDFMLVKEHLVNVEIPYMHCRNKITIVLKYMGHEGIVKGVVYSGDLIIHLHLHDPDYFRNSTITLPKSKTKSPSLPTIYL